MTRAVADIIAEARATWPGYVTGPVLAEIQATKETKLAQVNELTEHPSMADAEAAATAYREHWPGAGYGTYAWAYAVLPDNPEGPWKLSTSRDSSCD